MSQSLNSLSEEKEHLLKILSEKESSVEEERREKLELLREVAEKEHIEQLLKEKERQNLELSSQIDSLNEMNYNLRTNSEAFTDREFKLNARINEMERELENADKLRNEDDSKIAELEYELDILKRNYDMEIEGFVSNLQERETSVDILQRNNDSLKQKLEKAENLIKEYVEKESYFKSKLEESQGLIKYEQMQRQSATDSRINDLQQQLEESENHYQLELMNLRADNSNLIALESDLRLKIQELEKSKSQEISATDYEREINNHRTHIESLINQLEAERIEKKHVQELYEANISEKTFQFNNLLAQIEAERQLQLGIVLIILEIDVEICLKITFFFQHKKMN